MLISQVRFYVTKFMCMLHIYSPFEFNSVSSCFDFNVATTCFGLSLVKHLTPKSDNANVNIILLESCFHVPGALDAGM